jgi:hypothetical protein
MVRQFEPSILKPLDSKEIKRLLEASMDYWPHIYALCVMAAKAGNKEAAERYFAAFQTAMADKQFSWVEPRRQELIACLNEIGSEGLVTRLAEVQADKLRIMKLAA